MDDLIKRQNVIDVLGFGRELLSRALDNMDIIGHDRQRFEWGLGLIESYIDDIKDIPSAQTEQRKTGKWIKLDMHAHLADHKCTACGQECYVPTCMGEPMYTYCPNCGARMVNENEEHD